MSNTLNTEKYDAGKYKDIKSSTILSIKQTRRKTKVLIRMYYTAEPLFAKS